MTGGHNNVVPNVHFRKWWQRYVKTWFNQAGRKKTRRTARVAKAKKAFPRPTQLLKPLVHPATVRYNFKLREGRGFTFDELKAAGISKYEAKSLGVAVDHRRRNKCEESLAENVARLTEYKNKLVVFPAKSGKKNVKKGDSTKEECTGVSGQGQVTMKSVLPIKKVLRVKSRAITAEETAKHPKLKDHDGEALRNKSAYRILRKAIEDKRNVGRKIRRAKAKDEKKALK
jgi:large subunit ribosomal protein L13e